MGKTRPSLTRLVSLKRCRVCSAQQCFRCTATLHTTPAPSSKSKDEVERCQLSVGAIMHLHQEIGRKNAVTIVMGFSWKVELGGENRLARSLYFDVNVARST